MFFYILVLYFLITASHELGHFLAGWYLGIPKNKMTIQLFKYPPQVLLKDDAGVKVSVENFERYFEIIEKYIPSEKGFWLYVTGGHIFEFIIVLSLSILAFSVDFFPLIPVRICVFLILLTSLLYLVFDIVLSLYAKNPCGDFSGAYMLKPFFTSVFYVIYFCSYIWIYIFFKSN
ncbi:hypothetical protein PRVXH_002247 [Proteinivorax hydrogeniformans]|uniref:Peptidase M50B-like protein n=1 Tax=Proteinivorax hydrogeniformans TaxID=1826727 RepID=A0AAU8HS31_9FIRM